MILILTNNYISETNRYANGFVHTRVKAYQVNGIETKVFVLRKTKELQYYQIDGVEVSIGGVDELVNYIQNCTERISLCIHFLSGEMIDALKKIQMPLNIMIFVHGNEALHWYQRIFPGIFSNLRQGAAFCKYAIVNTKEIRTIQIFLKTTRHRCRFIAVSNWMKEKAESVWGCRDKYRWDIIPNYIDAELFQYHEKKEVDRYRLLSIRPFTSGKYANDITAKLIYDLSHNSSNDCLHYTWIGKGRLYKQTVKKVKNVKNLRLINDMLLQKDIPSFHKENGIFVCPTRQDAQGVSMCEAMSSGLVPITLFNTAIPEYLPIRQELICNNVEEMKALVEKLIESPDLFLSLSKECSEFIREKCSYENTIQKELYIMREFDS